MKKKLKFMRILSSIKFYKNTIVSSMFSLLISQQLSAQGTQNLLTIPAPLLAPGFTGTGNFNAIIFGNFTSNSGDVEGRLAVGGNFNVSTSGYSVGTAGMGVNAPNDTDNLVVNGQFSNTGGGNWGLRGNLVYNTAAANTVFPSLIAPGTITGGKSNHIKFSGNVLLENYISLSTALDGYANTGTVTFDGYHVYTLTGSNNGLNIFDITLPDNLVGDEIRVIIPAGATAIINVLNETLTISGGSMRMNGAEEPNMKVLFNFPKATFISLSSYKFLGSFLAPKASLNGSGGSINGQSVIGGDFDQKDGFEFHNFYFTGSFSALPVNLVKFNATKESGSVNLSWTTTSETNSSHFDIEHSVNGKFWNPIGTVSSNGESSQVRNYAFTDNAPVQGENLYRLKMVDLDETFAYSRIQNIKIEKGTVTTVFPNPASDRILINGNANIKLLTMSDLSGRIVFFANEVPSAGIDCKNLASGMYVVTMTQVNGAIDSRKVLIRK